MRANTKTNKCLPGGTTRVPSSKTRLSDRYDSRNERYSKRTKDFAIDRDFRKKGDLTPSDHVQSI